MALAEVDCWGEHERLMATAVAWLVNWIAKPSKEHQIEPADVMRDWNSVLRPKQSKPDRVRLEREE